MLDRRDFLLGSGALAACAGATPLAARGASPPRTKTFVLLFLRGGMDGLSLIVPHGDARYYDLRGWIAIPRPGAPGGAVELDGFFGLHPAAAPLQPLFADGAAAAVHAVGYANNSRSHFKEQDVWETAVEASSVRTDGWLNRHLQSSKGSGGVRAISIGDTLPRVLRGDARALALRGLDDLAGAAGSGALGVAHADDPEADRSGLRSRLGRNARSTLDVLEELRGVANAPYASTVEYPETGLAQRLREIARLVKADVGVEVCEVDFGGWDTHRNQGGAGGAFARLTEELAGALTAFCRDLEQRLDDVLVLAVSEFGRTARQNGTGGTDHGWGNCLLALGGPVRRRAGERAGPVLGRWPGLGRHELNQGRDLAHTTDFRDVFAEVARGHLGSERLDLVLPGHAARSVGLV
ncbi:MAG: DUF1501 domain-containing protein [Planctomycetota bacterium]